MIHNKRRPAKILLASLAGFLLLFVAFDRVIFPLPVEKLHRDNAHFVYDRNGRLLNCFASSDHFWRIPVELEKISPNLIEAVIATEDRFFYQHPGFNPISLAQAAIDNIKAGKVVRGGSTITMQIARMIEPKKRTVPGKLIEIYRAVQLELRYSKKELLSIYFNLVPYGGNIEGVGAAAYFYFCKTPGQLSWSEAAILTAIPGSPNKFRPDLSRDGCRDRRDRILAHLKNRSVIDERTYNAAVGEEIPAARYERPFVAPQFCQSIITDYPAIPELTTTIDLDLQTTCERLARAQHHALAEKDIHNLSLVVLDNSTGEILALVGSPDFEDTRHSGQINGALALRSPGSALKPFVYALGFEHGLITPLSRLDDIPVNYAGYTPENYDETHSGIVTVREALIRSLNIPAVNIAAAVGLEQYYDFLKAGGLSSLKNKYHEYGLPLVLGAGEVSLLELSNFYAVFGRGGIYRPVQTMMNHDTTAAERIMSEESCFIISDILANLRRPELTRSWRNTIDRPIIAWKTGTSYGRRDAWAVGYNPDFTVGVWAGNFSGEGSPFLVGVESASPLMLAVFDELTRGKAPVWFDRPDGVELRDVCTVSGMPPGKNCRHTTRDYFIKGVSPIEPCSVHKRIFVDHHTGYKLCRGCMYQAAAIDTQIVERWPSRLSDWMIKQGLVKPLPEHNPYCTGLAAADAPVIISPEPDVLYEIRASAPVEYQKIMFRASVSLESGRVHWFLDDRLYATAGAGENVFYPPEPGRHSLMCVDELGRSTRMVFEVR